MVGSRFIASTNVATQPQTDFTGATKPTARLFFKKVLVTSDGGTASDGDDQRGNWDRATQAYGRFREPSEIKSPARLVGNSDVGFLRLRPFKIGKLSHG
jgi:hypothetical protein